MKREDLKRNRELQKVFNSVMKGSAKENKLKKIDYMLWTADKEMFYGFFPHVCIRETDLQPVMSVKTSYKPLWTDDLLWDILKAPSNKEQPKSLRAIGAFTAPAVTDERSIIVLESDERHHLKAVLDKEIKKFIERIPDLTENVYIEKFLNSDLYDDVDKALIYIHQGKTEAVKVTLASTKSRGRFGIGDKTYRELMLEYIRNDGEG